MGYFDMVAHNLSLIDTLPQRIHLNHLLKTAYVPL